MDGRKKIFEVPETEELHEDSSYLVAMGDGTGTKHIKHKNLIERIKEGIAAWVDAKIPVLVNNLMGTEENQAMDARQGPVIDERLNEISGNLSNQFVWENLSAQVIQNDQTITYYGVGLQRMGKLCVLDFYAGISTKHNGDLFITLPVGSPKSIVFIAPQRDKSGGICFLLRDNKITFSQETTGGLVSGCIAFFIR